MVSINIKIEAKALTDGYSRYHGLAIDEPLNDNFWDTQPENKIGAAGSAFSYETTVDLPTGLHTLDYTNSGSCPQYKWQATAVVDGIEVATEECVGRSGHLLANFRVGTTGAERRIPFPFPRRPIIPRLNLLARIKKVTKLFRTKMG